MEFCLVDKGPRKKANVLKLVVYVLALHGQDRWPADLAALSKAYFVLFDDEPLLDRYVDQLQKWLETLDVDRWLAWMHCQPVSQAQQQQAQQPMLQAQQQHDHRVTGAWGGLADEQQQQQLFSDMPVPGLGELGEEGFDLFSQAPDEAGKYLAAGKIKIASYAV
jgi:hypothetical protein